MVSRWSVYKWNSSKDFSVTGAVAAAAAGQFLRLRKPAGLLLIPYLAWLIFATMLNVTIEPNVVFGPGWMGITPT